ncbi:MAG: antitoxin [Myxococcota bacterium]
MMRTTSRLDDDVVEMLNAEVHRQKKSMKQVVNEALRKGLGPERQKRRKRFRVGPHKASLRSGVDPVGLNELADELEDEAVVGKVRRGQ